MGWDPFRQRTPDGLRPAVKGSPPRKTALHNLADVLLAGATTGTRRCGRGAGMLRRDERLGVLRTPPADDARRGVGGVAGTRRLAGRLRAGGHDLVGRELRRDALPAGPRRPGRQGRAGGARQTWTTAGDPQVGRPATDADGDG